MSLQALVACSFLLMNGIPPTLLMDDLGHLSFPFCKMGGNRFTLLGRCEDLMIPVGDVKTAWPMASAK